MDTSAIFPAKLISRSSGVNAPLGNFSEWPFWVISNNPPVFPIKSNNLNATSHSDFLKSIGRTILIQVCILVEQLIIVILFECTFLPILFINATLMHPFYCQGI